MLVYSKFEVEVTCRLGDDLALAILKPFLKFLLVVLDKLFLFLLKLFLIKVSVSKFLSKVKIGLLELASDFTILDIIADSSFDISDLGHFLKVKLIASQGQIEANVKGKSAHAMCPAH